MRPEPSAAMSKRMRAVLSERTHSHSWPHRDDPFEIARDFAGLARGQDLKCVLEVR